MKRQKPEKAIQAPNGMEKDSKLFDKIIRENLKEFVDGFITNVLGIKYISIEDETEKIARTLEREPDFVFVVKPINGDNYVLHLEFQTTDEQDMHYRMFEYCALLYRIHKLPLKQYVIYIGRDVVTQMKTSAQLIDFEFRYNLISFCNVSYKEMLDSEIAEQVILAIICNYENADAHEIVRKIILRLLQLSDGLKLQKYLRQLRTLARLRNQQDIVKTEEQNMIATMFDVNKDPYFIEGVEKGIEKGIEKGEKFNKVKTALKLFKLGMETSEIKEVTELSELDMKIVKAFYEQFGLEAINHLTITDKEIKVK